MNRARPLSPALTRRQLLGGATTLGAGLILAGPAGARPPAAAVPGRSNTTPGRGQNVDDKIMAFALNLEYLEAEYYTRAAYGHSLADHGIDAGTPADIRGGRKVEFSSRAMQEHAEELAFNEAAHVEFYRGALGGRAPDCPPLDLQGAFAAVGRAAGLGNNFDPFADEVSFFLGGMLFEDVGVTGYHGAAPLITSKKVLDAAAGILAVEAYHMGMVRTLIFQAGPRARDAANAISDARDNLDGPDDLDQGVIFEDKLNIVPNDRNGIAFSRTPRQVLDIVYLKRGADRGGFYPDGMNGDFSGLI